MPNTVRKLPGVASSTGQVPGTSTATSENLDTRPRKRQKGESPHQLLPLAAQSKRNPTALSEAFSVEAWQRILENKDDSPLKHILSCEDWDRDLDLDLDKLTKRFNYTPYDSALDAVRQSGINDPAILKIFKRLPYISHRYSKSGTPYVSHSLNCQVPFLPNTGAKEGQKIECRHLAYACAKGMLDSKDLKFDFENNLSSVEAIQNYVRFDTEKGFRDLYETASEIHMISDEQFGHWIANQFTQMEKDSQKTKVMLVMTVQHAMALGLRIKEKEGQLCYVVKFYDPYITGKPTRSQADRPDAFETKTLGSYMFDPSWINSYMPHGHDVITLLEMTETKMPTSQTLVNAEPKERKLITKSCKLGPGAVYAFLEYGLAKDLDGLTKTFCELQPETQLEWLSAKHPNDGVSGLFVALGNGHADVVRKFAELLNRIPVNKRSELVSAKSRDGLPGLFIPLQNGYEDTVKAFAELLKLVPENQRVELLSAKRKDGVPGLFMALCNGHAAVVREFAELLKLIEIDQRSELVSSKTRDGVPGLDIALQNGCAEAVEAFAELLKLVPENQRAELVSAKQSDGLPGLFIALHNGCFEAVEAFAELLKLVPEISAPN